DPTPRDELERHVGQGELLRGLAAPYLRRGDESQAGVPEVRERVLPARPARLSAKGGAEPDAMRDHRQEEMLDIVRDDELAPIEERPGARRAFEREGSAHRCADGAHLDLAGRADELDDPAAKQLVDVDRAHRVL